MSRPLKTDLDCQGVSRVKNLPAPLESGDAVPLSHLNEALSGVTGQVVQAISEDLTITGTCVMFGSVIVADGTAVTVPQDTQWRVYE